MQYVLLTVINNEEDIIAYDSVITAYQVYKTLESDTIIQR